MNYPLGLERLSRLVRTEGDEHLRFDRYRAQLIDNIRQEEEYGSTERLRSDRWHIIDRLNQLCRDVRAPFSFVDACLLPKGATDLASQQRTIPASPEVHSASGMAFNEPVFVQTVKDRLDIIDNDYGKAESLFQAGSDVPLVDVRIHRDLSAAERRRYERVRSAHIRPLLFGSAPIRSVSIVIPIYGGGPVLAECLLSIGRQSVVQQRPTEVEVVVVEDGVATNNPSVFAEAQVVLALHELHRLSVSLQLLRLNVNHGRAQARNAGLSRASRDIVCFVDGSMILDSDALIEQLWRHARVPNVALMGFKENIGWNDFQKEHIEIAAGKRRPDFRKDLKWKHVLGPNEAGESGFTYRGARFAAGDVINYMEATRGFRDLRGKDKIGNRTLPSFFQTNIVSVSREIILDVGGFEPMIQGWGLEDTFLGALLLSSGCYLIPCPSAVAFNVEQSLAPDEVKPIDLELNRTKYQELISKTQMSEYNSAKFKACMAALEAKIETVQLPATVTALPGSSQVGTSS